MSPNPAGSAHSVPPFGGAASGILAALHHEGGIVGAARRGRFVSPSLSIAAPRFHSGLLPGELPAILKRGEAVLSERLTGRLNSTMGGLVDRASSDSFQRSRKVEATIDLRGANGDAAIQNAVARGVAQSVKISRDEFGANLNNTRIRRRGL